uniref:ADP-ribosyl cyclase/cyclic ADP-ribose hydrolase n=1 Tax=Globodera rostochiensis TaxID=31243 RepID=A0A914HUT4_GLORO
MSSLPPQLDLSFATFVDLVYTQQLAQFCATGESLQENGRKGGTGSGSSSPLLFLLLLYSFSTSPHPFLPAKCFPSRPPLRCQLPLLIGCLCTAPNRFASSGGGSCCATVVEGRENAVESSFMLSRQDVDVGEVQRKAGDAAGWEQPSRLEQAEEDDRDRLAPLKCAADGRHCFSPGSRSPLPVNASQPRPSIDIANGFYRTTTVVANGSGLLSLGSGTLLGAEQKSRSMGNLDRSGAASQSNGVDGRTVPSSSHQRSFSPSSSSGERANPVPRLQRQHWKYGSLRNCAFHDSAATGRDVAKVDANGQQHNGESGGKRMPRPKEIATEESRNSDIRLQQSLSTPGGANDPSSALLNGSDSFGGMRKESEYRRYRSEGSTSGPTVSLAPHQPAEMPDVTMLDDLSPTIDTIVGNGTPLSKHSSEQVMMMHTLKTKLQKYQTFIDKAFQLIQQGIDEQIFEGCTIVTKVMTKAWLFPKISHDLAYALCDYLRDQSYFETLVVLFIKPGINESVRLCCGRVLEECMASSNCELIIQKGYLKKVVATAEKLNKNQEQQRLSLSIMESLFKHSPETTNKLIDFQVIDHILLTCKRATDTPNTLRHAALALANLSLCSCSEAKKKLILKKLPDWLFLLASQPDDITRYYACLAICVLGSASTNSKEMEMAVSKSGTLTLVEPFLTTHQPSTFSQHDYKHSQGRPKEWLLRLLPLLSSKCREAKSMAAFHLCIEATIKKDQQKLEILAEIGAIQALKECASSPDELPAKFASEALTIIGEQYWVEKIGFGTFSAAFAAHMVDGDLLLLLTEKELEEDLADYSSVDETHLDQFLMSLSSDLSVYTYQMLGMGLNRNLLPQLTNDMMKSVCGIVNPIHRLKLRQALQDSKHIDDIEVAILSKQIDVFISYRRSTGNQLASLIKVLLQLRGYKVFIDVDRLYAGKFDSHLLKNIQAAKHFILVLTPHSLDRLLNDNNCEDWIHKELHCAFEHQKNVIPIFDQLFEFPELESQLPDDIRQITRFNGVRWVHDYQEACIDKVERFIKGELNRVPSLGASSLAIPASTPAVAPCSTSAGRKGTAYRLNGNVRTTPTMGSSGARLQRQSQNTQMDNAMTNSSNGAVRSSSIEKQRRKPLFSSRKSLELYHSPSDLINHAQ